MFQGIKDRYGKYRRHASAIALLAGFIFDSFTLTRIDLWLDNLILLTYLFVVGVSIIVINLYKVSYLTSRFSGWLASWMPIMMQFAFGGLFSGYVIFYTRSASLISSWPFLLILAGLLIGNEFFEKYYNRLSFQVSMFFVALFSFTIFSIPVLIGALGAWVFILSGIVSLILIRFFLLILSRFIPEIIEQSRKVLTVSIISIFIFINILYFANIIPPIPLSLKDIGVYHLVERVDSDRYFVLYEKKRFIDFFKSSSDFYYVSGSSVYVYSAVFAPTKLNTSIFHKWEYFDVDKDEWIETDRVSFTINGGRDGGYRGYSVKTNIYEGLWRVDVINKRGQLLGRVKFNVIETLTPPVIEGGIL